MSDPIIRANRWKLAYDEQGGLRDIFEDMRKAYFDRAGTLAADMPFEQRMTALESLSRASEIVNAVESHVRAIIDTGTLASANDEYSDRIASLPERKRLALRA